ESSGERGSGWSTQKTHRSLTCAVACPESHASIVFGEPEVDRLTQGGSPPRHDTARKRGDPRHASARVDPPERPGGEEIHSRVRGGESERRTLAHDVEVADLSRGSGVAAALPELLVAARIGRAEVEPAVERGHLADVDRAEALLGGDVLDPVRRLRDGE